MRMTQLFTRTLKQAPAGEVARNAQLLIRAGYVHKTMADGLFDVFQSVQLLHVMYSFERLSPFLVVQKRGFQRNENKKTV